MTNYDSPSAAHAPSHGGYPGTVTQTRTEVWTCLTCGLPQTGWGNNPYPIPDHEDREVCGDCNAFYVIPARLGQPVKGTLYSTHGVAYAEFESVSA